MGAGLRTTSKAVGRPPDPTASRTADLSRQPHAGFDVAGAGDVTMGAGLRPEAKAADKPPDPTVHAPALDPTGGGRLEKYPSGQLADRLPYKKCGSVRADPTARGPEATRAWDRPKRGRSRCLQVDTWHDSTRTLLILWRVDLMGAVVDRTHTQEDPSPCAPYPLLVGSPMRPLA